MKLKSIFKKKKETSNPIPQAANLGISTPSPPPITHPSEQQAYTKGGREDDSIGETGDTIVTDAAIKGRGRDNDGYRKSRKASNASSDNDRRYEKKPSSSSDDHKRERKKGNREKTSERSSTKDRGDRERKKGRDKGSERKSDRKKGRDRGGEERKSRKNSKFCVFLLLLCYLVCCNFFFWLGLLFSFGCSSVYGFVSIVWICNSYVLVFIYEWFWEFVCSIGRRV